VGGGRGKASGKSDESLQEKGVSLKNLTFDFRYYTDLKNLYVEKYIDDTSKIPKSRVVGIANHKEAKES